jgi:hypothetical protein
MSLHNTKPTLVFSARNDGRYPNSEILLDRLPRLRDFFCTGIAGPTV